MSIINKILGPGSKFDKSLPYTYEARVPIMEGGATYNSYFSDTICGLLEYLTENNIQPTEAEVFEVYQDQEFPIEKQLFIGPDGMWLKKPQLCYSFREHYPGHIQEGSCSFVDRDKEGTGP